MSKHEWEPFPRGAQHGARRTGEKTYKPLWQNLYCLSRVSIGDGRL